MSPDIWNVLHDGSVLGVFGAVPGDVQFAVCIDYLRNRFTDPGNRVLLTLHGCNALTFQPDGDDVALTDFEAIAKAEPEILQAKDWTDASVVECVNGTIRITAADFSLALDSGRAITFDDLCSVAEAYWKELKERS
jgi:hypothetical protein